MNSLISLLATLVLISTVCTLIFATVAYIVSRRPQRKKKSKVEKQAEVARVLEGQKKPIQTISMDGSGRAIPVVMYPEIDRDSQVNDEWAREASHSTQVMDDTPLFRTFCIDEDRVPTPYQAGKN